MVDTSYIQLGLLDFSYGQNLMHNRPIALCHFSLYDSHNQCKIPALLPKSNSDLKSKLSLSSHHATAAPKANGKTNHSLLKNPD